MTAAERVLSLALLYSAPSTAVFSRNAETEMPGPAEPRRAQNCRSGDGLERQARSHRTEPLLLLFLHLVEGGKESFLFCAAAFLSPLKDGFNINPIRNFFLVRKTGYCFRILGNKAVLEKQR